MDYSNGNTTPSNNDPWTTPQKVILTFLLFGIILVVYFGLTKKPDIILEENTHKISITKIVDDYKIILYDYNLGESIEFTGTGNSCSRYNLQCEPCSKFTNIKLYKEFETNYVLKRNSNNEIYFMYPELSKQLCK